MVSDSMLHSGATGFESWWGHELRYLVNFVFHPSLVTRVEQSHVRGVIDSNLVEKRTITSRSVQPNVHGGEMVTPLPSSDR